VPGSNSTGPPGGTANLLSHESLFERDGFVKDRLIGKARWVVRKQAA
jgi:hypothetical protein